MKKKILSYILAICLIIPCMFALCSCGNDTPMSKSELASTYKTIAKTSWEQLGAGDPTITETETQSINRKKVMKANNNLPNEMTEQTNQDAILNIKAGGATMASLINMIGEYYENENFIISNKVLSFDIDIIDPNTNDIYQSTLSVLPNLDKANNKVSLEMLLLSDSTLYQFKHVESYYNFEIIFDFSNNKMISYYLLNVQSNITKEDNEYEEITEIEMTKDEKYFGNENPSNEFKTKVREIVSNFKTSITNGITLTGNFSDEFNRYGENANRAYQNMYED